MSTLSMDFNYERMENEARFHALRKMIALIIGFLYGLRLGKYYAEKCYQFCTSTKYISQRFLVCLLFFVYYCAISLDKDHTCVLSYNVDTENKTVFTKS